MDPNANLAEQRRLTKEILRMVDANGFVDNPDMKNDVIERAIRLAELCEGLDQWISRHGGLPTDWHNAQTSDLLFKH